MNSVAKYLLSIIFVCVVLNNCDAQTRGYASHINELYAAISNKLTDQKAGLYLESTDTAKKENAHSWLWPLCAMIQATNEMETLEPRKSYMTTVENAIDQYYNDKPPTPAYQDYVTKERLSSRFYDDNEWIAIAYLDAYNRNHKKKYLDVSKMIYKFIQSGIDTAAGGGVYWKEGDKTTKNTCSNGPAILIALELYKITKDKEYLNTALSIYEWTNKYLQAPEGTYYDNIRIPTLKIAKREYTYNTGTMLQSNVLLYTITQDKKYLTEAERIAKAGKAQFFVNGRLPNNYWFNAVLLRGYIALYQIDKNKDWINFFEEDANQIWDKERDTDNMIGKKPAKALIDQAAMIEIYARLQAVENK